MKKLLALAPSASPVNLADAAIYFSVRKIVEDVLTEGLSTLFESEDPDDIELGVWLTMLTTHLAFEVTSQLYDNGFLHATEAAKELAGHIRQLIDEGPLRAREDTNKNLLVLGTISRPNLDTGPLKKLKLMIKHKRLKAA